MDQDTYITNRIDHQIKWYSDRSRENQRWYKYLRLFEICSAASIPFLVGYVDHDDSGFKIAIGILGATVAVIAGILGLFQLQEHWVEYRTTCESLKHEKHLFLTATQPYDIDNPFPLLVQRVESLISKENSTWSQYTKSCGQTRR